MEDSYAEDELIRMNLNRNDPYDETENEPQDDEEDAVDEFQAPDRSLYQRNRNDGDYPTEYGEDDRIEEDHHEDGNTNEDVKILQTVWINELNAPELLPYQEELISDMLEQMSNQQEFLDAMTTDVENKTEESSFTIHFYQMEVDRIKYMIASYLRTRLFKIEQFPLFCNQDLDMRSKCSPQELEFLRKYVDLAEEHVSDIALNHMPEMLRQLDAPEMVTSPDLDHFVFCQNLEDLGQLNIDSKGLESIQMDQHDRHVLRYRVIQPFLAQDQVKLI